MNVKQLIISENKTGNLCLQQYNSAKFYFQFGCFHRIEMYMLTHFFIILLRNILNHSRKKFSLISKAVAQKYCGTIFP